MILILIDSLENHCSPLSFYWRIDPQKPLDHSQRAAVSQPAGTHLLSSWERTGSPHLDLTPAVGPRLPGLLLLLLVLLVLLPPPQPQQSSRAERLTQSVVDLPASSDVSPPPSLGHSSVRLSLPWPRSGVQQLNS